MPKDPAVALGALLQSTSIEDHEEVLRAANAALKSNRNDQTLQHTRVVALLKLDRFDDAIRAIDEGGVKLETSCVLENAYARYKLGKLDEASQILSSAGLKSRNLKHLAAQVAYRAEKFDEAQSLYRRMLSENANEESNDLKINLKAAEAQAEWKNLPRSRSDDQEDVPESFELCYNGACAYIAQGALETAQNFLTKALTLCDASDDLTDEDRTDERRPILAQLAFVSAKLGDFKAAIKSYEDLEISSDADHDLKIIVANNRATLDQSPANPYLIERQVSQWMGSINDAKLFNFQSNILAANGSVVDLHANKLDGIKKKANAASKGSISANMPHSNMMSVLGAAAEVHGLAADEALRSIRHLSNKRPHDVGLTLTIAQLLLEQGKPGAALHVLEQFLSKLEALDDEALRSVRFSPGLVALAVSLKRLQKRDTSAKTELVKAADYWRNRPASSAVSLLTEAGLELAKSSDAADLELAGVTLDKIHSENPITPMTSAALVASLATRRPSRLKEQISELPSCESLIHQIDAERLVSAGVATISGSETTSKKRASPGDTNGDHDSKKRRRVRPPKNMVEGQTPDPERWLPLRDRSSYRPKGKKGKKKAAEATQGGVVKEEETLGLVGGGGVKVEKAASSNQNKKKKKGKK